LTLLKLLTLTKAYEKYFLNLITNSKYAKADSPPMIDIQSKVTDGIHQLIFSDQGLGFDLDKSKKIRFLGCMRSFMIIKKALVSDCI
jgi:hypothetical protein